MMRLSLTQRLSLVFALLLFACSAASAWLQINASIRHEQEVVQRVSFGLAEHIAGTTQLMDTSGWRPQAVRTLFDQLMAVNPSVELYLLDNSGKIVGDAAPAGRIKRDQVKLAPIQRFLSGDRLPILGDDPRSPHASKVFSAARVQVDGRNAGYVYVVLQGETHDSAEQARFSNNALSVSLWTLGLIAVLALVMGLIAFRLITRPLRSLTQAVRNFDANGEQAAALATQKPTGASADEISILRDAFGQMGHRISEQWQELSLQDQQRRDLIANISHDLRTPLTSLHGYLETLRVKDNSLNTEQRHHYLDIALDQSRKVGRLAQDLFELARLESGLVKPEPEAFALPDLIQDVLQKFELAAQAHGQRIDTEIAQPVPSVRADLAMVERVLTNLLDNAIRHNPPDTHIQLRLHVAKVSVQVDVADNGPPIPEALRKTLFVHAPALQRAESQGGGLGLIVVQRLLQLQGSEVALVQTADETVFRFHLPIA